jgi:hypothetical protein
VSLCVFRAPSHLIQLAILDKPVPQSEILEVKKAIDINPNEKSCFQDNEYSFCEELPRAKLSLMIL